MIILLVFTTLLLLVYCVLLFYYRTGWNKLEEEEIPGTFKPATSITILIPARNEQENLPRLLKAIDEQDYPRELFEVIVLDDFSSDDTPNITGRYGTEFNTIRLSQHVEGKLNSYKKKAIELGIHHSNGELIVTTDADCSMKKTWLKTIAWKYEKEAPSMIIMPVMMKKARGPLPVFQSLDFMSLQGVTGATCGYKDHLMCNGANLAYQKQTFKEVEGFSGIDEIASGDDMMLLHKMSAAKKKIAYIKSSEVIVETNPVGTVSGFISQRIRWASKSAKYSNKKILPVLLIIYFLNLLLLILPVGMLIIGNIFPMVYYWLLLVVIKIITELIFLWPVAGFFGQRTLLLWFPVAQPFHIVYTVVAGLLGSFGKYKWKGRTVK